MQTHKATWFHSSLLSTVLLFLATGILLVAHALESGALTLPFHGAAVSYFTLLVPLVDALLSYLIHGLMTGDWTMPNLSTLQPAVGPVAEPASITLYQDHLASIRPLRPLTTTDPPLPPRYNIVT